MREEGRGRGAEEETGRRDTGRRGDGETERGRDELILELVVNRCSHRRDPIEGGLL